MAGDGLRDRLPVERAGIVAGALGVGLVLGALIQELRKPRAEREWHGRVLHLVPYDFRPPTPARVRRVWNVNLARLRRRSR